MFRSMSSVVEASMFKKSDAQIILDYLSGKERTLEQRESYLAEISKKPNGVNVIYSAFKLARKKLVKHINGDPKEEYESNINSDGEDMASESYQIQYLFNGATLSSEKQAKIDMRVFRDLDVFIGNTLLQEKLQSANPNSYEPEYKANPSAIKL
jgi:hypothetical protein